MRKLFQIVLFFCCSILALLRPGNCFAIIEQNVKYLNGPFTVNHSFFSNQDAVFSNPASWSTINNLSVQDEVMLRVADSVLISASFSVTLTLDVKYYTNPDTVHYPGKDTTVILSVNYAPGQGAQYKGIANGSITGAYKINVTVTGINNYAQLFLDWRYN